MNTLVIKNETQYKALLAEAERLIVRGADYGSDEAERLSMISAFLETYEKKPLHFFFT